MNNTKANITNLIAQSQDGKKLNSENDEYSAFILSKIDEHTDENGVTSPENIISDFKYMINQLKSAVIALESITE